MKNNLISIGIILFLSMLFIPLLSLNGKPAQKEEKEQKTIRVLMSDSGQVEEITIKDYIFGVVSAEMPAEYETEAIKAQAVASYTYALYKSKENSEKEYDLTDSPNTAQHFIKREKAREKWGEKADLYEEKIESAVSEVSGQFVAYENKPILALYYAISAGKTENVKDVFGIELPYLIPVDSSFEIDSKGYLSSLELTAEEFKELIKNEVELSGEPTSFLGEIKRRENGYVESLFIGGKEFKGTEIRKIFSLRSANFDVQFNEKFIFTVRGYGHGVGLSQTGAQCLAKSGKTYKEILNHYYPNCEILSE